MTVEAPMPEEGSRIEFLLELEGPVLANVEGPVVLRCKGRVIRSEERGLSDPAIDIAASIDRYQFLRN